MEATGSGLPYVLYQDNRENSKYRGQWYARVRAIKTMTFEEFIKHIAEHGSNFTRAEISGVLYKMQDCLLELLMSGNKVQIGDLGTFYMTITSTPAPTIEDFTVSSNIKAVNLRFAASRRKINNLSSKQLRQQTRLISMRDLVTDKERSTTWWNPPSDVEEP